MKTAEEKAFRDKIDRVELEELMYDEFYELIQEAIKIGKANGNEEAYNHAIDDAAEKAKVKRFMTRYDYPVYCVDKQSILKLKK